jgi:hypothetical protein
MVQCIEELLPFTALQIMSQCSGWKSFPNLDMFEVKQCIWRLLILVQVKSTYVLNCGNGRPLNSIEWGKNDSLIGLKE